MEARILEQARRRATTTPVGDVASSLKNLLGRRLVACVAGVEDAKTVSRWAKGGVREVRRESEERVRAAYEVSRNLARFDSPRTVKAWFVGLDPRLGDVSPAEAIREGKLEESKATALAFVAGG